jgi:hypothetical protein
MDFLFVCCLQNCVINILSTVNKFSTCDNLLHSDDTPFSTTAVLAPVLAKLVDSSTTFSKFNLMTSLVTSIEGVGEGRLARPPRKAEPKCQQKASK